MQGWGHENKYKLLKYFQYSSDNFRKNWEKKEKWGNFYYSKRSVWEVEKENEFEWLAAY